MHSTLGYRTVRDCVLKNCVGIKCNLLVWLSLLKWEDNIHILKNSWREKCTLLLLLNNQIGQIFCLISIWAPQAYCVHKSIQGVSIYLDWKWWCWLYVDLLNHEWTHTTLIKYFTGCYGAIEIVILKEKIWFKCKRKFREWSLVRNFCIWSELATLTYDPAIKSALIHSVIADCTERERVSCLKGHGSFYSALISKSKTSSHHLRTGWTTCTSPWLLVYAWCNGTVWVFTPK
jgi:hypothetical protein